MKWFRKKPVDLIARCQAEVETLRLEEPEHDPFMGEVFRNASQNLVTDGGWCAPSTISYDILNADGSVAIKAAPSKDWLRMESVWG